MEQIPLFDDLQKPSDRFGWNHKHVPEKLLTLSSGQTVFHEGNRREFIFEVQSGTLKLSKVTEDGRQLILGFPSTGDIIGLAGVTEYQHTAETVSAAKLRPIVRWTMSGKPVLDQRGIVQLLDWIGVQQMAHEEHISLLAIAQINSRVAAFLVGTARKQFSSTGNSALLHLPMTQRDIATYLAIAPETYSRTLRKFRDAQILQPQISGNIRGALAIADIARLQEIACGNSNLNA